MSTALEIAKESYSRKKARLTHPQAEIEQAPQQPPLNSPPILGAPSSVDEVEVNTILLV